MRKFTIDVALGSLTKSGQLYIASVAGREVYRGRSPFYDGARSMVDEHGYQHEDVVTFVHALGETPPTTLNGLYWIEVRESERGGLQRRAWRGNTQDALCWYRRVIQDALSGVAEGNAACRGSESPGGPFTGDRG